MIEKNKMTQEEFCNKLAEKGGKEFKSNSDIIGVRSFDYGATKYGPDCMCNDRPPSVLVNSYPDMYIDYQCIEGTIEIEITGKLFGVWSRYLVYTIERGEFFIRIDRLTIALGRAWESFYLSMTESNGEKRG